MCVHFLFAFVNSIRFSICLNQISCNDEKTDGETKKSNRKCLLQQKCFWSEPKTVASFSDVSFVKNHEGNMWRNTKNLIKNFKFFFCFFFVFLVSLELKIIVGSVLNYFLQVWFFCIKVIVGSVLNYFLQVWFFCNICQFFVREASRFSKARLFLTDNDTQQCLLFDFCWWSICFRSNRWTFWIYCMAVFILYWQIFQKVGSSYCGSFGT